MQIFPGWVVYHILLTVTLFGWEQPTIFMSTYFLEYPHHKTSLFELKCDLSSQVLFELMFIMQWLVGTNAYFHFQVSSSSWPLPINNLRFPPIIWIRNIIDLLIGIGKQAFGVLVDLRWKTTGWVRQFHVKGYRWWALGFEILDLSAWKDKWW